MEKAFLFLQKKSALFNMNFKYKYTFFSMIIVKYS